MCFGFPKVFCQLLKGVPVCFTWLVSRCELAENRCVRLGVVLCLIRLVFEARGRCFDLPVLAQCCMQMNRC